MSLTNVVRVVGHSATEHCEVCHTAPAALLQLTTGEVITASTCESLDCRKTYTLVAAILDKLTSLLGEVTQLPTDSPASQFPFVPPSLN